MKRSFGLKYLFKRVVRFEIEVLADSILLTFYQLMFLIINKSEWRKK